MQRNEIQIALEAAAKISPHREFVIAGSLSVLGFLETPPPMMSMSIDIDFYPLQNPSNVDDIVSALGEYSKFHEDHGYYLDPITPDLPLLPRDWGDRLVKVPLGDVTAFFLDVHDTAISKYARGAENDYRWIDEGYNARILDFARIDAIVSFSLDYSLDEDKKNVLKGLNSHRVAMFPDGTLDARLLQYLRSEKVDDVVRVDCETGSYTGKIVWLSDSRVVQDIGAGRVAVHFIKDLQLGSIYQIQYDDNQVSISNIEL